MSISVDTGAEGHFVYCSGLWCRVWVSTNNNNNSDSNSNNNNNNTFVERHSAVASEALAEQVSWL